MYTGDLFSGYYKRKNTRLTYFLAGEVKRRNGADFTQYHNMLSCHSHDKNVRSVQEDKQKTKTELDINIKNSYTVISHIVDKSELQIH